MVRGNIFKAVLTALCAAFLLAAFIPGITLLSREGMAAAGISLWFYRTQLRMPKRYQSGLVQLVVIFALGLMLYWLGGVKNPTCIWSVESAKAALLVILAQTLGLVAVPACLCFYLCTPCKPVRRKIHVTMRRPGVFSAEGSYKIAV